MGCALCIRGPQGQPSGMLSLPTVSEHAYSRGAVSCVNVNCAAYSTTRLVLPNRAPLPGWMMEASVPAGATGSMRPLRPCTFGPEHDDLRGGRQRRLAD